MAQSIPTYVHPVNEVSWRPVDPDSLPEDWPKYRPMILRALMSGDGSYNERDVMFALLSTQWRLYADGDRSLCICEVQNFPRQRKFVVRYAVGEKESFVDGTDFLRETAREAGADVVEGWMRSGWRKWLPDWSTKYVVLQRNV